MASAVLASQNESSWGGHMGKIPYFNPHLNGSPNPKKRQKQFHHAGGGGNDVLGRYHGGHDVDSPVITQVASDDGYSFNQTSTSRRDGGFGGGSAYVTFSVSSYSKLERLELRKRWLLELDQIRDLQNRIDSGQFNRVENPRSQPKPTKKIPGSKRSVATALAPPVHQKLPSVDGGNVSLSATDLEDLLKECGKIVAKLIKHKNGYVFKKPVDVERLGLHDYHMIVKRPMDLGTVRSNISKKLYASPSEFAADVRLTFNNAMLYNPKHDPYHVMANQMLDRFEDMFKPIQEKIISNSVDQRGNRELNDYKGNSEMQFMRTGELQGSSLSNRSNHNFTSPVKKKKPKMKSSPIVEPLLTQAHSTASTPSNPPVQINQQSFEPPEQLQHHSPLRVAAKEPKIVRGVKLPKPKAKDPNKREMTMEEKQKLGIGLQSLPQEKMPQVLHIVRKRSDNLAQDGDEIELDIEVLDTETVWELDRFLANWKKMESKMRRQALLMNNNNPSSGGATSAGFAADADMGAMSDKNDDLGKKFRDNNEDEDVDIDDDMPETTFPPVEIEKDEGAAVGGGDDGQDQDREDRGNASSSSSSSGSSSSDSSSSSGINTDSDSDSETSCITYTEQCCVEEFVNEQC